mmetsp:Transcript_53970/g.127439  ORF Transcript_53970/g.127439 Transcript_53970/m.127439 type:complete len:210 (-) Transcript_53970:334-963(-)
MTWLRGRPLASRRTRCPATTDVTTTRLTPRPPPPMASRFPSRLCSERTSSPRAPRRHSCFTGTGRTACAWSPPSTSPVSLSLIAASCSPSHTSVAAARWVVRGMRTWASISPSGTPSPTSAPAASIFRRKAGPLQTRWLAGDDQPVASSLAPPSTFAPTSSASPWLACPSSISWPPWLTPVSPSPSVNGRSGATPTRKSTTSTCCPTPP